MESQSSACREARQSNRGKVVGVWYLEWYRACVEGSTSPKRDHDPELRGKSVCGMFHGLVFIGCLLEGERTASLPHRPSCVWWYQPV